MVIYHARTKYSS